MRTKILLIAAAIVSVASPASAMSVGLSGSAAESSLLEVVRATSNFTSADDLLLFEGFDERDVYEDGELLWSQVFEVPADGGDGSALGCDFGGDSVCTFTFGDDLNIEYVVAKAAGYLALYSYTGGELTIDTSAWGEEFDEKSMCLVNGSGECFRNSPAISNIRGIAPVPEPNSALLFGVGALLASRGRRRRR